MEAYTTQYTHTSNGGHTHTTLYNTIHHTLVMEASTI